MSGVVVAIGILLLIPSIIGILISALFMFAAILSTMGISSNNETTRNVVQADLTARRIPFRIIDKVINEDEIPQIDLANLSKEQRIAIQAAQTKISVSPVVKATAVSTFIGIGVCYGLASFISGLIGWLLVMRKKVLQCDSCGAVISAS